MEPLLGEKMTDPVGRLEVGSGSIVNSRVPTVMELAEIQKVLPGFDPGSHGASIGDAWVRALQQSEVNAILHGELDVAVMELQAASTLGEVIASVKSELALGRPHGLTAVLFEVPVVGVGLPGLVLPIVNGVGLLHYLVVRLNHQS
jgi:hypothetical protein